MNEIKRIIFFFAGLLIVLLCFYSCKDELRDLRSQIRKAGADGMIDATECDNLRALAAAEKTIKDFDQEEWEAFLREAKPREIKELTITCSSESVTEPRTTVSKCGPLPERVHMYVENSGSMYAYMDKESIFYRTLMDFVVQFNEQEQDFAYYLINDKNFPIDDLPGEYRNASNNFERKKQLEAWLTPAKMSTKGNRSSSRLMEILNKVSQETLSDCEPRMIFSDFVYSVTDAGNMAKEMAKVQSDMSLLFNDVAKAGLGTLIIKFNSEFDGNYYPYNSPTRGYKYKGSRPFYGWLIGAPEYLKGFVTDYTINKLPGYEAHAFFAPIREQPPSFSIMPYSGSPNGEFRAEPQGKGQIVKALEKVAPLERPGLASIRFAVGADLSTLSAPASYLEDTANYQVDGDDGTDGWRVAEVKAGAPVERENRLALPPSHLIIIEANGLKARRRDLQLKLLDRPPEWLKNSHTDSDLQTEIDSILGKTFGFRYLVAGVWDAYHPRKNELLFFSFPITVER